MYIITYFMSYIKQDIKQCMYAFIINKLYLEISIVVITLSSLDSYKVANCLLQNYYDWHSDRSWVVVGQYHVSDLDYSNPPIIRSKIEVPGNSNKWGWTVITFIQRLNWHFVSYQPHVVHVLQGWQLYLYVVQVLQAIIYCSMYMYSNLFKHPSHLYQ